MLARRRAALSTWLQLQQGCGASFALAVTARLHQLLEKGIQWKDSRVDAINLPWAGQGQQPGTQAQEEKVKMATMVLRTGPLEATADYLHHVRVNRHTWMSEAVAYQPGPAAQGAQEEARSPAGEGSLRSSTGCDGSSALS